MRKIKCLILDDEPLAVELLKNHASKLVNLDVVLATTDAFSAVNFLQQNKVDLIFIDIQMPEISGLQMIKMFNNDNFFVITSAYPNYALESFEFRVIDYLTKPITFEKFHRSVEKFMGMVSQKSEEVLFIKSEGKQIRLDPKTIVFIEGLSDYIRIHTENERYIVHGKLKEFIQKLPSDEFLRIHKSFIIKLDKIISVEGNLVHHQLGKTPIGETYKNELKNYLNKFD